MSETTEIPQEQLEQNIKSESAQQAENLQALESEKVSLPEPVKNFTAIPAHPTIDADPQRQTKDFVEKHGDLNMRREKKHTGRGLDPQHEEERAERAQTVQAKDRLNQFALKEALLGHGDDYEEEDTPTDYEIDQSEPQEGPIHVEVIETKFQHFFDSLDRRRSRNSSLIEKYLHTHDKLDRLELLTQMHVADAAIAVLSSNEPGSRYILKKLKFYKNLSEGNAIRKRWDYDKSEFVDTEELIPASDIKPENIAVGLMRNILYAEMKGTPELAAFNIAIKRVKNAQRGKSKPEASSHHMPDLFGYHSQIHYGRKGIGAYPLLQKIYQDADRVVKGSKDLEELANTSPQELEHKAVMLAAQWYAKAMEYDDPRRSQHSPYSSLGGTLYGLQESIAWARLGEPVQKQLRGMRQKIQGVDLHNIGRFIGKAGDDKYGRELRKIHWELEHVPSDPTERTEWTLIRNDHDLSNIEKQYQRQKDAITSRLLKRKMNVLSLELPEEERTLQLQNITTKHDDQLRKLTETYQVESQRISTRTPEQIIEELKARQEALKPKHEKHKSLAEKALDLHFTFNHKITDDRNNDDYYKNMHVEIDWINSAPIGTIKRVHSMLEKGVNENTAITYAIAEIISGKNGVDKNTLAYVKEKFDQIPILKDELQKRTQKLYSITRKDWSNPEYQDAYNEMVEAASAIIRPFNLLQDMMRVSNILNKKGFSEPIETVAKIADSGFHGRLDKIFTLFGEYGIPREDMLDALEMMSELGETSEIVVAKTLQAGFGIEEIRQYPFLLSPLISEISQKP